MIFVRVYWGEGVQLLLFDGDCKNSDIFCLHAMTEMVSFSYFCHFPGLCEVQIIIIFTISTRMATSVFIILSASFVRLICWLLTLFLKGHHS